MMEPATNEPLLKSMKIYLLMQVALIDRVT